MTDATRILIVDDDPIILKILRKALEGMGEVHSAASGAQALQIVAEHPIDLVLLDIIMPEMDGFATCRALLQAHPDLTVIFVTAASDTASEIKALEVGGHDFINKPINPAVVRARVTLHLKLRAQYAELKRIEELARRQLAEIQAYYDTAPVGLFVLDTELRYLRINERLAAVNGQPVAAHLGRTVRELLPDLADSVEPLFHQVIATGEPVLNLEITEKTATRPGGQRVWRADYYPLRNAAGDIIGINGFAEDITRSQQIEQNLRDSERRFRELFEHLPIAYQSLDHQGRWLYANQAMADLLGYETPEALLGREFGEYWDEATRDRFPATFAAFKATGSTRGELRLRRRDGSGLTAILTGRIEKDRDGQFLQTHCVLTDISERRAMEEAIRTLNATLEQQVERRTAELRAANAALRESEERYRKLFEDTRQAVLLLDDGRCVAANRAALAMLRLDRMEQLQGRTPIDFSPPLQPDGRASAEKAAEMSRIAVAQGSNEFEWTHVRADGELFTANVTQTLILQGEKTILHSVLNDITDQKKAQERVEYLAYHDALTGLPNRVRGQERLQQAVATAGRQQTPLAVLYLDLDKFKFVNDHYGHRVGDLLLKSVGLRLTQTLHADDVLCRLSADEFMIVLSEVRSPHRVSYLGMVCERLLADMAEPFDLEARQIFVSIAIGLAIYPDDGGDSETLMRNADTALFEAKKAGDHSYRFFEPRMNADLNRFVHTREALRSALERQEFAVHYQPQVDLRSHRVVGVEALLRWQRPGEGMTMPCTFMDVAEDSGLIVPIGRWVLHEACRQAAAWQAAGWTDLIMAVKLSAKQFRQGQLEQDVQDALDASGLAPAALELELTESILLENAAAVQETVARWKARGIQLAIDDFGTGYSSLAYLKRFKVDRLKIDRSFILDLLTDEEARAIVLAMIQVARSLNLRTIAEGVEETAVAERLKVMGCDEAQGYLYGRPLPAVELEEWLANVRNGTDTLGQPQPSARL